MLVLAVSWWHKQIPFIYYIWQVASARKQQKKTTMQLVARTKSMQTTRSHQLDDGPLGDQASWVKWQTLKTWVRWQCGQTMKTINVNQCQSMSMFVNVCQCGWQEVQVLNPYEDRPSSHQQLNSCRNWLPSDDSNSQTVSKAGSQAIGGGPSWAGTRARDSQNKLNVFLILWSMKGLYR